MLRTLPVLVVLVVLSIVAPRLHAQAWHDMLSDSTASALDIIRAHDAWEADHPGLKNRLTQDYKRWLRRMTNTVDPAGYASSAARAPRSDKQWLLQRKTVADAAQASDRWTPIGPFAWDKEAAGIAHAPGLAHCYVVREHLRDTSLVWAGTATAGAWRSRDAGRTWANVTATLPIAEVRALALHPVRTDLAWIGAATGVWRTTDGGATWEQTAIRDGFFSTLVVWDLVVMPNADSVLLAATNRGLFRSTDGGTTFDLVADGLFYDLEPHPTSTVVVYAVRRSGESCTILRSRDAGLQFEPCTSGLPVPDVAAGEHARRWAIAVTPAAPSRLYVMIPGVMRGGDGTVGVYLSRDEGTTFEQRCCGDGPGGPITAENPNLMCWDPQGLEVGGQYYYDLAMAVSPVDPDRVYVGGINVWLSTNGGASFTCNAKWTWEPQWIPRYTHADIHAIVVRGRAVWVASDGGLFFSANDLQATEDRTSGINGTEFFGWGAGFTDCDVMLGGTYHNGVLLKDHDVYKGWHHIYGGDNAGGMVNAATPRTVYADLYIGEAWQKLQLTGSRAVAPLRENLNVKPTSNIVFHPYSSQELWAGTSAGLQRSTNHGRTWQTVASAVGSEVVRILRIAEARPHILYTAVRGPAGTAGRILRSDDGGTTMVDVTPPDSLVRGNAWRFADLAISATGDTVYLAIGGRGTDPKVVRSLDGGSTWADDSRGLPEPAVTCLTLQYGANGRVMAGTEVGVYTRPPGGTSAWTMLGTELPVARITTMDICYRENLLRAATNRGVWEIALPEASKPVARAAVDRRTAFCTRDSLTFHDLSIVRRASASRRWVFPGGNPSTSTEEHPVVTYERPGTYGVSLMVMDEFGSSRTEVDSIVTVLDQCRPDSVPGQALLCDGSDGYAAAPPTYVPARSLTIAAWIRRSGRQASFAGIVFARSTGTATGLSIMPDGTLRYHAGDAGWWNAGTMVVPDSVWTHVALTVDNDTATLFINGIPERFVSVHPDVLMAGDIQIGRDATGGRVFRGMIDEVQIHRRALTVDEVRRSMHCIPTSADGSIVALWQFNEGADVVIDHIGTRHAGLTPAATYGPSSAPVGIGIAESGRTVDDSLRLPAVGCSIVWQKSSAPSQAQLVISRIRWNDDRPPNAVARVVDNTIYILRSYGVDTFSRPARVRLGGLTIGSSEAQRPSDLLLFRRPWLGDSVWSSPVAQAQVAIEGLAGALEFVGGLFFDRDVQFAVGSRQSPVSVPDLPEASVVIAPNPASEVVRVRGAESVTLLDLLGKPVGVAEADSGTVVLPVGQLPRGTYFLRCTVAGRQVIRHVVLR